MKLSYTSIEYEIVPKSEDFVRVSNFLRYFLALEILSIVNTSIFFAAKVPNIV